MKKWWDPGSTIKLLPYNSVKKPNSFDFRWKNGEIQAQKSNFNLIMVLEIWYSSSTFNRAWIWYPWRRNRSIFEKKILSPIYIEVFYTYDASAARDQKHGFLKFWTLNFENGPGWTLGTPWDGSPKKIPAKNGLLHWCYSLMIFFLKKFCRFLTKKIDFESTILALFDKA